MTARLTRGDRLAALNSATKYPSIPTYHTLGSRGILQEEPINFGLSPVIITEKVDGTNVRLIFGPTIRDPYIIGSREELLTAGDDLIHNPASGIVDAVRGHAQNLQAQAVLHQPDVYTVVYGELYGIRQLSAWKKYNNGTGEAGFQVFDVAHVPVKMLDMDRARLSAWREDGGQAFLTETELQTLQAGLNLVEGVTFLLTPRMATSTVPTSLEGMRDFMTTALDASGNGLRGVLSPEPEGIVLRTPDRRVIAKARFEDYHRTLNLKGGKKK